MKLNCFIVILVAFLCSCGSGNDSSQTFYHGFTNNAWEQSKTISFSFDISDTAIHYDVHGKMRINETFSFSTLDMSLSILTPSGSSRLQKIHLEMRNNAGERTGSQVNGYYEIAFPVYDSIRFAEPGKWTMNFNHNMPVDIYEGMIGLEVFIEKQK